MRERKRYLGLLFVAFGVCVSGWTVMGQQMPTYRPITNEMALKPDPADWIHFRRTADEQGYSPLDQINRQNVKNLTLAWSWTLHPGTSEPTPQVHDGIMFASNPNGGVQAFNAANGDLLWDFQLPLTGGKRRGGGGDDDGGGGSGTGNGAGPSRPVRNLALYGDKVYTATSEVHGGRLIALDARTGKIVWETPTGKATTGEATPGGHSGGPIAVNGKIVLGTTKCEQFSNEDPPCHISAWDAETGKELWRTSTVARPGEPGGDTWGDLPLLQRAGSDNWQAGSYDPVTNLTYWGTSQAKPWTRFLRGDGAALYTNSTLALNLDTGKMQWYFQHIPGETLDMDDTFERVLVDYDGKSSVFSMGKIGILWELDRKTGQYRNAYDTGYQDQGRINPKTGQLEYFPEKIPKVDVPLTFCPGVTGVKSWKAMAYSPQTQAFYVPLFPHCQGSTFIMPNYKPEAGQGGTGGSRNRSDHFHPKSPEHLGDFIAMDVKTGQVKWRHRTRTPPTTSVIATAGGLVVVGDWDRWVRIYDANDGTVLYETRLPSPASGSPSTYSVNGKQYIAIPVGTGSGGNWVTIPRRLVPEIKTQTWDEHMTGIFVFALPDK